MVIPLPYQGAEQRDRDKEKKGVSAIKREKDRDIEREREKKRERERKEKERKRDDFPHNKNGHNSISGRLHHCVGYSRIQRLTFSLVIDKR